MIILSSHAAVCQHKHNKLTNSVSNWHNQSNPGGVSSAALHWGPSTDHSDAVEPQCDLWPCRICSVCEETRSQSPTSSHCCLWKETQFNFHTSVYLLFRTFALVWPVTQNLLAMKNLKDKLNHNSECNSTAYPLLWLQTWKQKKHKVGGRVKEEDTPNQVWPEKHCLIRSYDYMQF